ncbi:NADPH-dependent ferric siderophore reductase [Arthrobacter sp. UYCu712]
MNWVPRSAGGDGLVDADCTSLTSRAASSAAADADNYRLACEVSSTRRITEHLRKEMGVDKRRITALGYWRASSPRAADPKLSEGHATVKSWMLLH